MEHRFTHPITPSRTYHPRIIFERGQGKLNSMYERTERDERHETHGGQAGCHQTGTHSWSAIDPGDTHDKGEESLCVGEAA